jgi:hypothetical protein
MNPTFAHPGPEAWLDFLYGELPPAEHQRQQQHLAACPTCAAELALTRRTLAALDTWKIPVLPARRSGFVGPLKWAAAAVLVLGVGLAAGRLSAPQLDPTKLRADVASTLRQEFQSDLRAVTAAAEARTQRQFDEFTQAWITGRAEDQQASLALYDHAQTDRKADYTRLRRDLETVAIHAELRLDTTERALDQIALAAPAGSPHPDGNTP